MGYLVLHAVVELRRREVRHVRGGHLVRGVRVRVRVRVRVTMYAVATW